MTRYLPTSGKELLTCSCLRLREYSMSPPPTISLELISIVVEENSGLSGGTSISDVDAIAAC